MEERGRAPIGVYYLSSGQAATRLGLCKRTLLRAMHRGEITPAYQTPGGYFRFRLSDIEAYAARLNHGVEDGHAT